MVFVNSHMIPEYWHYLSSTYETHSLKYVLSASLASCHGNFIAFKNTIGIASQH